MTEPIDPVAAALARVDERASLPRITGGSLSFPSDEDDLKTLASEVRRLREESRCAECEHDAFVLVSEDLRQAESALAALREQREKKDV